MLRSGPHDQGEHRDRVPGIAAGGAPEGDQPRAECRPQTSAGGLQGSDVPRHDHVRGAAEGVSDTYNGQALWYAGIGSQKNYMTLYLMNAYGDPKLQQKLKNGFKAAGKKLDMGKACIRFKAADDLALDAVADVVASTSLDKFVATAKAARAGSTGSPAARVITAITRREFVRTGALAAAGAWLPWQRGPARAVRRPAAVAAR